MLSPVVEKDFSRYYQSRNGNAYGVPVVILGVNTDEISKERSDQFIRQVGFQLVVDDPDWISYAQFGPGNSASRYVIINGVADSPTHKQWEVLVNQVYFDPRKPEVLRAIIDSVKPQVSTAPRITVQPQSQTVPIGAAITLSVAAAGTAPLSYQWHKAGVPIPAATSSSLVFSKVAPGDAGDYSVMVSNSTGSETSQLGTLNVREPIRPALSALRRIDGGGAEFVLSGEVGRNYHIEFSTDLKSWTRVATLNAGDPRIVYRDTSAAAAPQGFYRALGD